MSIRNLSVIDITVKAALEHDPGESRNVSGSMYCIAFLFSFLTYPLFSTISLPTSLRLCVWRTVKQMARARMTARQKEGESERQKTTR